MINGLTVILLFFPSITFGLLKAEIFPWGTLLFLIRKRFSINKYILCSILVLLISSFLTIFLKALNTYEDTDIIRSLAAYVNVLLTLNFFLGCSERIIDRFIKYTKYIFVFLLILGLLQNIGMGALGQIISLLIPRGSGEALSDSGRGVTLLATEPARAGVELSLIYFIVRCTIQKHFQIVLDLIMLIYLAVILKTSTALGFFGLSLIVYYVSNFSRMLLILSILCVVLPSFYYFGEGRAANLFRDLVMIGLNYEMLFFLMNESGNRLLSIYAFLKSGINNPLGYGVGSWPSSSIMSVVDSGFDYREFRFFDVRFDGELGGFRGSGLASNLFLDIGLIGFLLISTFIARVYSRNIGFTNAYTKQTFYIFLLKIFLIGSPGHPLVFIMFFAVALVQKQKTLEG